MPLWTLDGLCGRLGRSLSATLLGRQWPHAAIALMDEDLGALGQISRVAVSSRLRWSQAACSQIHFGASGHIIGHVALGRSERRGNTRISKIQLSISGPVV